MAILLLELCKIIKKGLMVILPINPFYVITFDNADYYISTLSSSVKYPAMLHSFRSLKHHYNAVERV